MTESFLDGRVTLHAGDCLTVLARLEECSIDSCVTDPPYHLTSIVQRFGGEDAAPMKNTNNTVIGKAYTNLSRGFMGKQWDGGDVAFRPETWAEVYRVLKPGGYLLAFSGTRTYHRMACAIEDAGFEVRDMVSWIYGSGFPKSHDVSKGIDKAAGAERESLGVRTDGRYANPMAVSGRSAGIMGDVVERTAPEVTTPATDAAREWQGWGTSLKPALEPICMARKPLSEKTVAANVLEWGTGAINVDGCRVRTEGETFHAPQSDPAKREGVVGKAMQATGDAARNHAAQRASIERTSTMGRWPANVIHDGSEEVVGMFPDAGGGFGVRGQGRDIYGSGLDNETGQVVGYGDSGSAARFFYSAKADSNDRIGSKHPTVKPVDLMQYLVRLVTKPGGTVLDPFAGTGTTGEAAFREGMRAVLIEAEAEYQADIRRRMALVMAGPDERVRESVKARGTPIDYGPLFAAWKEAAE